uniref:Uncharacterized protein n=1 Tax=viral metagenome TaxID=1070528 RepID=A0A6H1ZCT9_9ZZZZ
MALAVLRGRFHKITVGTYALLGASKYSISGLARATLEASEYGDDVDKFEFGTANGGTITISDMLYDPLDSTGQALIDSACLNASKFGSGGLCFYVNTTSYKTVASGGHMLVTKSHVVESERNGLAKCSFEVQVSGAAMVLV